MSYYLVKSDLFGVPKGRVERFHQAKAALLVHEGKIEPYDEKNKAHVAAREKQEKGYADARRVAQAKLDKEQGRA